MGLGGLVNRSALGTAVLGVAIFRATLGVVLEP